MQTGFMQCYSANAFAIREELGAGLREPRAHTSPKYLYDALGSKLFEAICELQEYYPTRTEAAIFKVHLDAIARSIGRAVTLIDLGAGNCAKAARLFPLVQPAQYVPVDISVEYLRDAVGLLRQRFPQLAILGLGLDFSESLKLPEGVRRDKRLFFYAGSSIGNFTPEEAKAFLRRLRGQCDADGGLLIGVDLIKDRVTLDHAYDDALGVTAAFNLNLLRHLNAVLGTNFDVRDWRHRGFFNAEQSRVEMHLEARREIEVIWPGNRRRFKQGETIHTENSYKYEAQAFINMLAQAGFGEARLWTDAREWFAVVHARAIA